MWREISKVWILVQMSLFYLFLIFHIKYLAKDLPRIDLKINCSQIKIILTIELGYHRSFKKLNHIPLFSIFKTMKYPNFMVVESIYLKFFLDKIDQSLAIGLIIENQM
jgi:hypothetical protein